MRSIGMSRQPRRRVLVVESDRSLSLHMHRAAERVGCDVKGAVTGAEALEAFKHWHPDVLVLDNQLTDMSGIQLATLLQSSQAIPMLFIAASFDDSLIGRATALGAATCLQTPLDVAGFELALRVVLARTHRRREVAGDGGAHERRFLAAELHDGVGQELAAAALLADVIEQVWLKEHRVESHDLTCLRTILESAQAHCRELAAVKFDAFAPASELGLELQRLTFTGSRVGQLLCTYTGPNAVPETLPDSVAHHLLRIAQEAVNNALRHSGGRHLSIRLAIDDQGAELSIRDDGIGFGSLGTASDGLGFRSMQFRASLMGGQLYCTSPPTGGFEVRVTVPSICVSLDIA